MTTHHSSVSVKTNIRAANVMSELKPKDDERSAHMSTRKILIVAGGTGGHLFGYDITRINRALVFAENVPDVEVLHV